MSDRATGAVPAVEATRVATAVIAVDPVTGLPSGTATTPSVVGGNVAAGAADSGNPLKIGAVYYSQVNIPTYTTGQRGNLAMSSRGSLRVLATGVSNSITNITGNLINSVAGQGTNDDTGFGYPLSVMPAVWDGTNMLATPGNATGAYNVNKAGTSGGATLTRVVSGTTGAIKASAGQLFGLHAENTNAAKRYLHFYNKATAPTLSTDTPILTITLPAATAKDITWDDLGCEFTTGIAWAYTTDDVAIPTTAATSGELHFSARYK